MTAEPEFCTVTRDHHGRSVRCYLTAGRHHGDEHEGITYQRAANGHAFNVHIITWPVQAHTECGNS